MEGLKELEEGFLKALVVEGYSPTSRRLYGDNLGLFFAFLEGRGITDVRAVRKDDLLAYQVYWVTARADDGKPYSVGTQAVRIRGVKRFFEWLEATDRVFLNVAEDVKEPPLGSRLPKVILTEDEVKRLMEAPNLADPLGVRDRTILEVFYSTAIRREELLHLILEDVDLEGGVLRVNLGKGAKDRVVPFGEMAKLFLRGYLREVRPRLAREGVKALFVSKHGEPLTKTVVGLVVKGAGRKAGLGVEISPHVLRHTCATHMVRRGADVVAVSKLLGHSDLSVTQRYVHVAGAEVKQTHRESHPRERDMEPVALPMAVPLAASLTKPWRSEVAHA
jgi:integrase/recombinase XerD